MAVAAEVPPPAARSGQRARSTGALIQAYQNNPQLNAQRAATRAIDENVPQALAGYRPRVSATSEPRRAISRQPDEDDQRRAACPAIPQHAGNAAVTDRRRDRHADAVQRLPDRQPHAAGGRPGVRRARDAAHDRADRAAQRGHRLHESAARRRDPRAAAQQRRRAGSDAAADARPLQRRRGDPHRRGAGGIAAGRRPLAAARPRNRTTSPRARPTGR